MMREGFMALWDLGPTISGAKAGLKEYAAMGFGLSLSASVGAYG